MIDAGVLWTYDQDLQYYIDSCDEKDYQEFSEENFYRLSIIINPDHGAKPNLFIFRAVENEKAKVISGKSFSYNFGDGWRASVKVTQVKSRSKSNGFRNYDWMVSEIVEHGRILEKEERDLKNKAVNK